MTDLRQALADISAIRSQVAGGTQFRGYGPLTSAISGVLALVVAAAESYFMPRSNDLRVFLAVWTLTAAVSVILAGLETIGRARRVHRGLATAMIHSAVEQFLPSRRVSSSQAVGIFAR